jgi:hypothetical protein
MIYHEQQILQISANILQGMLMVGSDGTNPANILWSIGCSPLQRLSQHLLCSLDIPTASAEIPPEARICCKLGLTLVQFPQRTPQFLHLVTQIQSPSVLASNLRV